MGAQRLLLVLHVRHLLLQLRVEHHRYELPNTTDVLDDRKCLPRQLKLRAHQLYIRFNIPINYGFVEWS